MRTSRLFAAALCLPALLMAQAPPESKGQIVCAKFTSELHKLTRDYRVARQADPKAPAPDYVALARRAVTAAGELEGDDRAQVLCWAAVNGRDEALVREVVADIGEHHLLSPAIEDLMENAMTLSRALGQDDGAKFLQRVVEASPHAVVRAWAMYWEAVTIQRDKNALPEQKAAGDELMAQAEKLAEGTLLGDRIAGPRFIQENLQIGMTAPDIVGEDIDGVGFKLSDYRGKVVVLDFWGFW